MFLNHSMDLYEIYLFFYSIVLLKYFYRFYALNKQPTSKSKTIESFQSVQLSDIFTHIEIHSKNVYDCVCVYVFFICTEYIRVTAASFRTISIFLIYKWETIHLEMARIKFRSKHLPFELNCSQTSLKSFSTYVK